MQYDSAWAADWWCTHNLLNCCWANCCGSCCQACVAIPGSLFMGWGKKGCCRLSIESEEQIRPSSSRTESSASPLSWPPRDLYIQGECACTLRKDTDEPTPAVRFLSWFQFPGKFGQDYIKKSMYASSKYLRCTRPAGGRSPERKRISISRHPQKCLH